MSEITIYAAAGLPAPASESGEFALDAGAWFTALLHDPHMFFGVMPLFLGHSQAAWSLLNQLLARGVIVQVEEKYRSNEGCPSCSRKHLRNAMRVWASRIMGTFVRCWDSAEHHQELINQVTDFFLRTRPEIVNDKMRLVFNVHTKTGERRKLVLHEASCNDVVA